MRSLNYAVSGIMLFAVLACLSSAAFVGSSSIRAPAVITYNNTGSLTTITLTITTGNGNVIFTNSSMVANSTLYSAQAAAEYAAYYTNRNFSHYNFTYTIMDDGNNVSGPSAGAAMTLLAVSAFENRPLGHNFTITGTINSDGTIGQIGGAIDKVAAASRAGLELVLVPSVDPGSLDQGVYYIAQTEYHIPLVEVSNIPQAANYAFGSASGIGSEIAINLSNNYNVAGLPQSTINCSNSCDEAPFSAFTNYTIGITKSEIANLSSVPGFAGVAGQIGSVANQTVTIHQKGYLYISADIAFLSYLDAFYLNSYNTSRGNASAYMSSVQTDCSGLLAPQLTSSNYEYVIGAELRQGWANYTINQTISGFNATGANQDDIVASMYSTGQAQAWCGAVSFLYNYPYQGNGAPVTFSQSLEQTAIQRINRAHAYPGMYLTLAREAYKQDNYPVAIIDADYAYALTASTQAYSDNATSLLIQSAALAANSTYGVWTTEFSKESAFYAYESSTSKNSTAAQFYADQAYTSADLASLLSNDTKAIYASLVAAPQTSPSVSAPSFNSTTFSIQTDETMANLSSKVQQLTALVGLTLALLIGCIVLLAALGHKLLVLSAREKKGGRGRKTAR